MKCILYPSLLNQCLKFICLYSILVNTKYYYYSYVIYLYWGKWNEKITTDKVFSFITLIIHIIFYQPDWLNVYGWIKQGIYVENQSNY